MTNSDRGEYHHDDDEYGAMAASRPVRATADDPPRRPPPRRHGGDGPGPVVYALVEGGGARRNRDDDNGDACRRPRRRRRVPSSPTSPPPSSSSPSGLLSLPPSATPKKATAESAPSSQSQFVVGWYDRHAMLYPSIDHLERRRLRRREEEGGGEASAARIGSVGGGGGGAGGWLRRLLGWGGAGPPPSSPALLPGGGGTMGGGEEGSEGDAAGDDGGDDDGSPFFDARAIPPEATSFHRLRLASALRALSVPKARDGADAAVVVPARPPAAAPSPPPPSSSSSSSSSSSVSPRYHCIVGYGRIAEFRHPPGSSFDGVGEGDYDGAREDDAAGWEVVGLTSDWRRLTGTPPTAPTPREGGDDDDVRCARAASIGRDCIAVSWGRRRRGGRGNDVVDECEDGDLIVFYRRRGRRRRPGRGGADVVWEAVASAHPSGAVVRAALGSVTTPHGWESEEDGDEEGRDEEMTVRRRIGLLRDAGTLAVSDLVSVPTNDGRDVVLAISRLGGYVELVPLPGWVWRPDDDRGGLDDDDDDDDEDVAAGDADAYRGLPDLAGSSRVTAFTTSQHNRDVTSLDAYIICPPASAASSSASSSASPPPSGGAEFVLATCGGGGGRPRPAAAAAAGGSADDDDDGAPEVVTLWAVSIVRPSSSSSTPGEDECDLDVSLGGEDVDDEFELNVRRLDHLTIDNVGADSSVFLSDVAAERWTSSSAPAATTTGDDESHGRPPASPMRKVTRREGRNERRNIPPAYTAAVATAAVPVAMLRFTPPSSGGEDRVLLAVLDCNGGVSVLDCTASIRMATTGRNSDPPYIHDGISKKIRLLCSRDSTMTMPSGDRRRKKSSSKGGILMASASQIEWWSTGGGGGGHDMIGRCEHPNAYSAAVVVGSPSSFFTLVTYATLITDENKKRNDCFHENAKLGGSTTIVRMQRWSWSSGIAKGHDRRNPSDVFCMPFYSNNGSVSIALLPMPAMPRQRQQNEHPSSFYHEMMPFLRLSAGIVPTVNPASSSEATPPHKRLHLSMCAIKKFLDPAEIIAALLRRGDASRAIGVARRFGIGDEGGQSHYLGEEGRLMMNQCRIRMWEDRSDVKALKLISDDAYVISQALGLLQCRDCVCGVRDDNIDMNEGLNLSDLLEIFRDALARCDALGDEESASSSRQLRDAVRRIGTFKLLLNHYVDKTSAFDADAAAGLSSTEQCLFARRFLRDFKHKSLYGIAASAASKGDIDALTVLIVRHPLTMSERMRLLDLIPLEVDIGMYEQLLPCHIDGDIIGGWKDAHSFLPRRKSHHLGNEMFLSPSQLFTHLSDLQLQRRLRGADNSAGIPAIDIFTDDADKDHVMLHFEEDLDNPSLCHELTYTTKVDVATWYLNRALGMHNQTGQVLSLKELCAAGLARLGFMTFTEGGALNISDFNIVSDSSTKSQAVGKLVYLYSSASFFCRILADKLAWTLHTVYADEVQDCRQSSSNESFEKLKGSGGLFLSVVQFCSMDLKDTIPYIIENSNMHSMFMFQKHLAHFYDGSECLEPRSIGATVSCAASENMSGRLEHDMIELCVNNIRRLRTSMNTNSSALQPSLSLKLEESLSLCADFALFCFGARSMSRIAQNENCLIEFLERIFNSAIDVMEGEWDVLTEVAIRKMWSIFELLPYITPHESDGPPPASTIYKESIGGLHFRLVALQLCCKWHGGQTFHSDLFSLLHAGSCKEKCESNNQGGTRDLCLAGRGVISIMCIGFCERAAKLASPNDNGHFPHQDEKNDDAVDLVTCEKLPIEDLGLLFDFISDVDEFDGRFFSHGAQQSGCVGKFLCFPLLYQHCFVMLKNILKIRSSWFCQDFTSSIIASFIQDAGASTNKNANILLAYQELLGKDFPKLSAEFEHQQRMIAAKEFMTIVMELDNTLLGKLFSIVDQSAKPIDLICALIEMDAPAILLGCEFWGDKMSALAACTDASVFFSSQISALLSGRPAEESSHVLPPMPGALVIQLSNIIGMYSPHDILLVKRFMVNGALRMNLGPAAVAICYSMLCDAAVSRRENNADSLWDSHHQLQVLNCVVAIAKSQTCLDPSIKRDLCTLTLQLLSIADSHLYRVLLDLFKELEYELLALELNSLNDDAAKLSGRTNDFLVFKAAGLVARGARDLVDNSNKSSDAPMKLNTFYDRSMNRVFRDIKKSLQADLLKVFFRIGDQAANDVGLMESMSEAIFQWVVAEAFLARNSSIPLSLPAANMFMMTELGLSCLLEFQGQGSSLVMKRTFQFFKAKSRLPIAQNSAFLEPMIQPDKAIIKRLRDRGYGRNAAHRAVIMTGNQGYSAALTWAVSHFADTDFDSPIFCLHSDTIHAEQSLVNMADKLLQSVQNRVKVNWPRTGTVKHDPTLEAATKPSKAFDESYGIPIMSMKNTVSKIPCRSPFASPLQHTAATSNAATASGAAEQTHATVLSKTTFVSKIPSPSTTKACLPHNAADKCTTTPDSASSIEGSLSSRASVKNQIKLGKARFETQKLSLEERKQLALEGKRLLNAARAQRKNVFAPPTTITTSHNDYNPKLPP